MQYQSEYNYVSQHRLPHLLLVCLLGVAWWYFESTAVVSHKSIIIYVVLLKFGHQGCRTPSWGIWTPTAWGCRWAGWASGPMHRWRRCDTTVRQGMFLPQSPFCANCLTFFYTFFFYTVLHCPLQEIWVSYPGRAQELQEQCYPFLLVSAVFPCVQTMVWLPVFGIFNVHADVDACDCTQGLYGHRKRVCTGNWLGKKSLAAPGMWTCVSIAPGFSVGCSTSWAIPTPHPASLCTAPMCNCMH